jgi:hypothetical protein
MLAATFGAFALKVAIKDDQRRPLAAADNHRSTPAPYDASAKDNNNNNNDAAPADAVVAASATTNASTTTTAIIFVVASG